MTNNIRTDDEHIAAVRSLLGQKLPNSHDGLIDALRALELLHIGTIDIRIKAQSTLLTKRLQYLHPKDPKYTDMDRKIMLEGNTADEEAQYETALATEKALIQRIGIIQTLLIQ